MIKIRNVMFDENFIYDKNEIDLMQLINESILKTTFEIPNFHILSHIKKLESDSDEKITINKSTDQSINTATQLKGKQANQISFNQNFFPSSNSTSDSENFESFSPFLISDENSEFSDALEAIAFKIAQSSVASRRRRFFFSASTFRKISSKIDDSNIVSERMKRIKIKKQTYFAAFDCTEFGGNETFHDAFNAHINVDDYYKKNSFLQFNSNIKIHRNHLSSELQHYDDFRKHFHADEFKQIMRIELKTLKSKNTGSEISIIKYIASIFIIGVYKYKFDDQNYLIKHKISICARDNFQKTDVDTYAVTLTVRIFRTLMIIINAFDLKTRQYNAVNAFVNSEINEFIYFRSFADGIENENVLLFLHGIFYDFKQSSVLGYKHFSKTLIEFDLNQISDIECLFINDYMLCFFFVNDIVVLFDRQYTEKIDEFEKKIFARYEMRYFDEIEGFLNIKIVKNRHHRLLYLCQDSYINKFAMKFKIDLINKIFGSRLAVG